MAPDLEKQVAKHQTSNGRKMFYGESGDDLRLKQPGFKWSLINDRRHQISDDFAKQLSSIFEEYYEKITGQDKRLFK